MIFPATFTHIKVISSYDCWSFWPHIRKLVILTSTILEMSPSNFMQMGDIVCKSQSKIKKIECFVLDEGTNFEGYLEGTLRIAGLSFLYVFFSNFERYKGDFQLWLLHWQICYKDRSVIYLNGLCNLQVLCLMMLTYSLLHCPTLLLYIRICATLLLIKIMFIKFDLNYIRKYIHTLNITSTHD